jgi:hypothetical protein
MKALPTFSVGVRLWPQAFVSRLLLSGIGDIMRIRLGGIWSFSKAARLP